MNWLFQSIKIKLVIFNERLINLPLQILRDDSSYNAGKKHTEWTQAMSDCQFCISRKQQHIY